MSFEFLAAFDVLLVLRMLFVPLNRNHYRVLHLGRHDRTGQNFWFCIFFFIHYSLFEFSSVRIRAMSLLMPTPSLTLRVLEPEVPNLSLRRDSRLSPRAFRRSFFCLSLLL